MYVEMEILQIIIKEKNRRKKRNEHPEILHVFVWSRFLRERQHAKESERKSVREKARERRREREHERERKRDSKRATERVCERKREAKKGSGSKRERGGGR